MKSVDQRSFVALTASGQLGRRRARIDFLEDRDDQPKNSQSPSARIHVLR